MKCVFVQIQCHPGKTYEVADEIALMELHSELYSTSGEFALLVKLYIPRTRISVSFSATRSSRYRASPGH